MTRPADLVGQAAVGPLTTLVAAGMGIAASATPTFDADSGAPSVARGKVTSANSAPLFAHGLNPQQVVVRNTGTSCESTPNVDTGSSHEAASDDRRGRSAAALCQP